MNENEIYVNRTDAGEEIKHEYLNTRTARKTRNVLVVDDDKDTAGMIQYIIEAYSPSVNCTVVYDPYEALLKLIDKPYDFVLIDQRIPGFYGSEILKQVDYFINKDPIAVETGYHEKRVPVVIMSGTENLDNIKLQLKHFRIQNIINKKDLGNYLAQLFAN